MQHHFFWGGNKNTTIRHLVSQRTSWHLPYQLVDFWSVSYYPSKCAKKRVERCDFKTCDWTPPAFFCASRAGCIRILREPRWIGYDQVRLDSSGFPHFFCRTKWTPQFSGVPPLKAWSWLAAMDETKFSAKNWLKQRKIMRNRKPKPGLTNTSHLLEKENHQNKAPICQFPEKIKLPFVGTSSSPANMSNSSVWDDHQSRALASARGKG